MSHCAAYPSSVIVALHPEGVDRNPMKKPDLDNVMKVALHPEGVDRNSRCAPV